MVPECDGDVMSELPQKCSPNHWRRFLMILNHMFYLFMPSLDKEVKADKIIFIIMPY